MAARLYANENFPLPVVEALRGLGHDVLTSQETGQAERSISDEEVLDYATNEGRAILALNRKHFVRLHQERPGHASIVAFTFEANFERQAHRIYIRPWKRSSRLWKVRSSASTGPPTAEDRRYAAGSSTRVRVEDNAFSRKKDPTLTNTKNHDPGQPANSKVNPVGGKSSAVSIRGADGASGAGNYFSIERNSIKGSDDSRLYMTPWNSEPESLNCDDTAYRTRCTPLKVST